MRLPLPRQDEIAEAAEWLRYEELNPQITEYILVQRFRAIRLHSGP